MDTHVMYAFNDTAKGGASVQGQLENRYRACFLKMKRMYMLYVCIYIYHPILIWSKTIVNPVTYIHSLHLSKVLCLTS